MLMHGPAGTGKRHFAEALAASLLCGSLDSDGSACGVCSSCHWFDQRSHPDFRLLSPEGLLSEPAASSLTYIEDNAGEHKKSATQITIEQIRELRSFVSLSAHKQGGTRVVLIHPADSINVFAANALLKMLEEPPAQTLFLLVTDELRRLLPTIISRCRRYPMPGAEGGQALDWLRQQGIGDAESLLAQAGGAPVAASALAKAGLQAERRHFFDQLITMSGPGSALALAALVQKIALPTVLRWLSTWCYDLLAVHHAGSIRYHLDYRDAITQVASRLLLDRLLVYLDLLKAAAASVAHPLNPRLFLEQLLLSYSQTIAPSSASGHARTSQ
ncbi:MAG: DNA polymerase III subunit delta' [Burkholderiales bacterium]|nr:DNA polymerase III subunit delta' [Burkholderiales bacterium]